MVSECQIVSTLTTGGIMRATAGEQFSAKVVDIFGTTRRTFDNDQCQQFTANGSVSVPCSFAHHIAFRSVSSRLTAGRSVEGLTFVASLGLNLSVNRPYERIPASFSPNRLDTDVNSDDRRVGQVVD